ncbi:hypothetical protein BV22DRAFT_1124829 [Leucogyrophana mollusca]|uniref:Uncharacterized protein n=1 Tax=Leucogyrophana mollusca TaxID=85980 RepID=A0ACB8BXB3_9AGAM|nr:hypothetical protein BV22DRAFT_1124829 [Leucogyrophana mollusca]
MVEINSTAQTVATTQSHSPAEPSTPPPNKSRDSFVDFVFNKLHTSPNGIYAATPDLVNHAEYFHGGRGGDVLVKKHTTHQELILRGLFEISRDDFYFTPDASYNPANNFQGKFEDAKLSCRLIAVHNQCDVFTFAQADYPIILKNLRAFEKLITKEKGDESVSVMQFSGGYESIKLSHSLFKKKPAPPSNDSHDKTSENNATIQDAPIDLGPDFKMSQWPVQNRCQNALEKLIPSHDVQPLPAWNKNKLLIPPKDYEETLRGATVEVHMALVHHYIKKEKRHVFNLMLRELIVRADPAPMPESPFKRRRLDAGPSTEVTTKGKETQH